MIYPVQETTPFAALTKAAANMRAEAKEVREQADLAMSRHESLICGAKRLEATAREYDEAAKLLNQA